MNLLIGTSGFQYKPWRGSLYARDCKERDMLAAYAGVLPTVELNNTFYRLPKVGTMAKWATEVPAHFRFAVKAPRWLAPVSKASVQAAFDQFGEHLEQLGDKLGRVLFQSPPNVGIDLDKLAEFLERVPRAWPIVVDLRHPSWQHPEVFARLRARDAALCLVDSDEPERDWVTTGAVGYVRLRRSKYSDAELRGALARLRAQPWDDAFVYFKHDD